MYLTKSLPMTRTAVVGVVAALSVLAVLAIPAAGQVDMGDDGEPITGANATVTSVSAEESPNPASVNETVTLSASADNATRYAWDVDADGIGEFVGQNVTWTPSESGNHTIAVRATNISNSPDDYAETNLTVRVVNVSVPPQPAPTLDDVRQIINAWARGDADISEVREAINRWATDTDQP